MEAREFERVDMLQLSTRLNRVRDAGITLASIANACGVNRSLVSTLVNKGAAGIGEDGLQRLSDWVDRYEAQSNEQATPQAVREPDSYLRELELFETESYQSAIGYCLDMRGFQQIGVLTGLPGTGKTTIARKLLEIMPNAVYIEAQPYMRIGDLMDDIAAGIGMQLSGSITHKHKTLINRLKGTDTTIIVDEAEYLKKWNTDKLDMLRKIQDNTGIALILMGTPAVMPIIDKMETGQLSSRMFRHMLTGVTAGEIKKQLAKYEIEPAAAEALTKIATDHQRGGLRNYTLMMKLCLKAAQGGKITMEMLKEARGYKVGLG